MEDFTKILEFKKVFDILEPVEWASFKDISELQTLSQGRDIEFILVDTSLWCNLINKFLSYIEPAEKHSELLNGHLGRFWLHGKGIEIWTDAYMHPDEQFLPKESLILFNSDGSSTSHQLRQE